MNDKEKKIGIITFHSAHNYGAVLQAFASQKFLEKSGYNTEIINYRNPKIDKNFRIFNIDNSNIKKLLKSIIRDTLFLFKNIKKYNNFEKFINKNFNLTLRYNSEEELKNNPPKEDIYITGSDQIWSYYLLGKLEDSYTLNFGDNNVKRISYAASAGDSDIIFKEEKNYKEKLKVLNNISVREDETKENLEKILNRNVDVVLDPTLLIDEKEWEENLEKNKKIKEKYIFVYTIGMHKENAKIANELSDKTGYKIVHLERINHFKNTLKSEFGCTPFQFLNLIKNSEYVVTTSFHATVFSILFEKKFWVVKPPKAGNRISSLLKKLSLEERIIENLEGFKNKQYDESINYKNVKKSLKNERENSKKWLLESIEGDSNGTV